MFIYAKAGATATLRFQANISPEVIEARQIRANQLSAKIKQVFPESGMRYADWYISPNRFPQGAFIVSATSQQPWGFQYDEAMQAVLLANGAVAGQNGRLALEGVPIEFSQMLKSSS
jgi:hypothetical protein